MIKRMRLDSQINSVYSGLTKSEKKVANYVLEHQAELLNGETLAQLAKACEVGEATIMRFIYKLGYDNYAEFKVTVLKESLLDNESQNSEEFQVALVKEITSMMNDSLLINNKECIVKVAKMIKNASHIYFMGNGTSGFVANIAAYRFFRGGASCESITDVHLMRMKAALVKENELIIAISQSGDNTDIINSVKLAQTNNCPIITITGREVCGLNKYANVKLIHAPVSLINKSYYGGMVGIMIQEFLLEVIFNAYSDLDPEVVDETQQITTIYTDIFHESLRTKGDK